MTTDVLAELLALETQGWVEIANRVVLETQQSTLVHSVEPEARCAILLEWTNGAHALYASLLKQIAMQCSKQSAAAQEAATAVRQMEMRLQELPTRIAAAESSMMREVQLKYELRTSEMEEGGAQLVEQKRRLQDEVVELERRRDAAALSLHDVDNELDERRGRLQEHKIAAGEQMNALESSLESLRAKVAAERAVLQRLEEEESVRRRKAELLAGLSSRADGSSSSAAADGSTPMSTSGAAGGSAVRPSENRKLDFGLATLQNVREQLRELREARTPSGSPNRVATAPASDPSTPYYSITSAVAVQQRTAATADATPGSASQSPMNPWKARLMKLQGDLKTLRADLATT